MLSQHQQRVQRFAALGVVIAVVSFGMAGDAAAQQCGPMDVVFVIDNTATMEPVNTEIQNQVGQIADAVIQASGGDYQFGMISAPENDVVVLLSMAQGNRAALDAATDELSNVSSCGLAAAWDEALNTALNGLGPRQGASGAQTGSFNAAWRGNASKIIIVITDTDPGGFNCDFNAGVHDTFVRDLAAQAQSQDIHIATVFVPTGGGLGGGTRPPEDIKALLGDIATISQGLFFESREDATDLSEIIVQVVQACGGGARSGPTNLFIDPTELVLLNNESGTVRVLNREPAGFGNMTIYSVENIDGSPHSFTASFHPVESAAGVEELDFNITVGPATFQGTHLVVLKAEREGAPVNYAILHVIVECRPPFFLGTRGHQPQNATVARGGRATLTAVPGGDGPLHYQWYRGPSGTTTFPIAGANNSTFTTEPITTRTPYWVRVSNACGSKDSKTAFVTPTN